MDVTFCPSSVLQDKTKQSSGVTGLFLFFLETKSSSLNASGIITEKWLRVQCSDRASSSNTIWEN